MVCSVKPGATQCWTGKPVLKTQIFQFDLACSRLCFQSFNHKRWRRKVCVNQVCQCGSYWLITCLFKYQNSHRMERLKGQPPHTAVAAASGWRLDSSTCGGWEAWLMLLCSGALRGAEISICAEGPVVLNAACQRWGRLHNTQGLGATTTRRWISIERAEARPKPQQKRKRRPWFHRTETIHQWSAGFLGAATWITLQSSEAWTSCRLRVWWPLSIYLSTHPPIP